MLSISQGSENSSEAILPLQREAPDAEALEEDTVRAEKEAALVGDEREGRRKCPLGAGPLLGQLHFLPSVEAEKKKRCAEKVVLRLDVHSTTVLCLYGVMWTTYHAWVLRL